MKTQEIKFAQVKSAFAMTCRVETEIHARAEEIWGLLTDAKHFSNWNSTVSSIEGDIREGERIHIHVPGTNRIFRPTVSGVAANKSMTWSNGIPLIFRGTRTFELLSCTNGCSKFIMEEHFSGILFALIKNKLPDFKPIFERFAHDLKKASEWSNTKSAAALELKVRL